jgi:DNA polymerase-1
MGGPELAKPAEHKDGFLYGAGDAKIGSIIGKGPKQGKLIKQKFLAGLPALAKLKEAIDRKITEVVGKDARGNPVRRLKKDAHLVGLDGRLILIKSQHAALNYLLQSAGSLLVKQATVYFNEEMDKRFRHGEQWAQVGHFHDEMQVAVRKDIAEEVGKLAVECFERAGRHFNFRCPITGEFKTGANWAETH